MASDREPMLPVLVADDDEALRRLLVRTLQRAGFATREARDGREARRVIDREPLGLALLDIQMPGIGGIELVRQLRAVERTSTLPVILITGTADVPDRIRGLQAGADDYLIKGTDLAEVVARVQAHMRARTAWSAALGRELANRAGMVAALAGVPSAATPEETAAGLVERLAESPGVAFVSLLAVEGERGLAPLAGWKRGFGAWTGGPALARPSSGHLLERAAEGPWREAGGQSPVVHAGRFSPHEVGTCCFAPLMQNGGIVGLLVMATEADAAPFGPTGDLLATTIDLAAVTTAVLGDALASRRRSAVDRRDVELLIAERAFAPVFQPLVRLADREVVGYEALTRFTDGTRPDLRFREAARLGLGRRLERETLSEAIRHAATLPADRPLGVNVTPSLVLDPGWLAELAGQARQRLVIELTEHAEVVDYEPLRRALATLAPRIEVAVDDAGAGYASLRHILELHPRYVKIDMALVRGIEADRARQSLITGLEHCVSELGGTTIAEGVESEAEAETLAGLGIAFGQGYLFGRPAPAATWAGAAPG